jgi:hypothetical protein
MVLYSRESIIACQAHLYLLLQSLPPKLDMSLKYAGSSSLLRARRVGSHCGVIFAYCPHTRMLLKREDRDKVFFI